MSWMVGVDVGGTFTDFFAFNDATDRIILHKVPSTPADPAQAVVAGMRELGARHGVDLSEVVRHDGCDQRADPAARRQGRAGGDRGLSRLDRDRTPDPPACVLAAGRLSK